MLRGIVTKSTNQTIHSSFNRKPMNKVEPLPLQAWWKFGQWWADDGGCQNDFPTRVSTGFGKTQWWIGEDSKFLKQRNS